MVAPMLIWGSIAGCDIVTRSGFSGKRKLVPCGGPLSCQYLTSRDILRLNNVKEMIAAAAVVRERRRVSSFGQSGDYSLFMILASENYNFSSMYNAPAIGFGQYGAISANPSLRYRATASFITGSTVSRRIRW